MKAEWTNKDSLSIESTGQKAILVIDMPTDCIKCPLANGFCWNTFPVKGKAEGCPLKPMPEYQQYRHSAGSFTRGFTKGWNTCIKELEK